ncbi:hypothetical protein C8R48DRAFT_774396 [Suillus tomentosus]|nr:hypothetical protein C8R48DRAFT_774396 [Suillus tomentosus]
MSHQYLYMSITAFWIYEYACSFHEEWEFLRRSRWTKVKVLYIITRYLPFFLIAMYLCLNLTPSENTNKCRILINIYSFVSQISLTFSESFFALRTYALWNNNRIVLLGLLSTAFVMVVTSVGIRFTIIATSNITASTIPGIQGCSWSPSSVLYLMLFIFLFVFQLGLVFLTLIHVIQSWRSSKGHLYIVLVKHNIFYYACGLLFSAINVIMPVLFPNSAYYIVLEDLQVCILRILATRMHLHLWHLDQHMHSSDALICISTPDMSPADCPV